MGSSSAALIRGEGSAGSLGRTPEAFERDVRPALPGLYRFCLVLTRSRADADDLLQEVLVKAYENAAQFDGRGTLVGWLCGIARRERLEQARVASRRQGLLDRVLEGCAEVLGPLFGGGSNTDPEQHAVRGERARRLITALHEVPEEYRVVLEIVDVEGLSHSEASEVLAIPIGTIKSRHARGRARLLDVYRTKFGGAQ